MEICIRGSLEELIVLAESLQGRRNSESAPKHAGEASSSEVPCRPTRIVENPDGTCTVR